MVVTARAQEAGLGHFAPHDLRRSAAGILHTAVTSDCAHHFDLLDFQRVLGHSDPAATMRSNLEPMATDVFDRAAIFLTDATAEAPVRAARCMLEVSVFSLVGPGRDSQSADYERYRG